MGRCSHKGRMIYSDLNLWALFWSSNLIPMVHLWSSNTDLRVSLSFSLIPRLTLSVFITSSSSPFKSVLFLKKKRNYFCLFLRIIALHICVLTPLCFLRSVWGRHLNGSCWIIFTMESRLKSQITRGQEREQEGGLQVCFFSPLFPPIESQTCIWMGRAGCIQTYTWIRLCWGFPTHP